MIYKALAFFLLPLAAWAFEPIQVTSQYQVRVDLTSVVKNRVKVEMVVPILEQDEVVFNMPKIIPGTYSVYNYGQFLGDLKALDSSGEELPVEQLNANQWRISSAKELYKIAYWVSDSYHQRTNIFAPAGTAISAQAALLNNFGFVGYLENRDDLPFDFQVKKQPGFFGSSALPVQNRSDSLDVFTATNYFQLHDCPILYAQPDTASILVAGIPIHIAVYSPEGNIKAQKVRDAVAPVFSAAAAYLGDTLPAAQYAILIYGQTLQEAMRGSGALEHHTSTVVNVPDVSESVLKMFVDGDPMQIYRDIVAHEFFHIVTPLNIHAKQIADYDFINPQMSEHLWLYEGVTEYNSMIAQLRGGIFSMDEFMRQVKEKMDGAKQYDQAIPFTQMSRYALTFFSDQYHNVYQQGALIGMAVDLKLHALSDGEYGLVDLLKDMWNTYGADTFFVDDELFRVMAQKSYPEMEEFLVRHVAGTEPLPLGELLEPIGISYHEKLEEERISTGDIQLMYHPQKEGYIILNWNENSAFAQEMGIKKYDLLRNWNGVEITKDTDVAGVIANYQKTTNPGDKITLTVERTLNGKAEEIKLKTKARLEQRVDYDVFTINESLTTKQRTLRDLWINN